MLDLTPFEGVVWRIVFATQEQETCKPVSSPIGRFHHSGQVALYTSCSEEGAGIAIKRYVGPDDPDRIIAPLQITANSIFDIRKTDFVRKASIVWQDLVAEGVPSPTWEYSVSYTHLTLPTKA